AKSRDLHLEEPIIAATRSSARGWIAVLDDGRLITSSGNDHGAREPELGVTDDVEALLQALHHADGAARPANDIESTTALRDLEQWLTHDWTRRSCAVALHVSPLRQRTLRRLESALRSVPRHRRPSALALAASIRTALERRLTLGVERALDDLPDDEDAARWLEGAARLLSAPGDNNSPRADAERPARARAIILLGAEPG
ncbi:MAG TPA: hypothetical protein VF461_16290, partial [Gemmatimonadaceae bacterium]